MQKGALAGAVASKREETSPHFFKMRVYITLQGSNWSTAYAYDLGHDSIDRLSHFVMVNCITHQGRLTSQGKLVLLAFSPAGSIFSFTGAINCAISTGWCSRSVVYRTHAHTYTYTPP